MVHMDRTIAPIKAAVNVQPATALNISLSCSNSVSTTASPNTVVSATVDNTTAVEITVAAQNA